MQVKALSWNLFHGRDFPPDPALFTWRSRLLRITERNASHVQVNRDLFAEFARVLVRAEWDVALLQECPPRWWAPLAEACKAEAHGVLTSRNSFGALRALAARLNPDLIASGEGGSNLTLVRSAFSSVSSGYTGRSRAPNWIVDRRSVTIREGRPERRTMGLTQVAVSVDQGGGASVPTGRAALCIANLHATTGRPDLATEDVLRAAEAAAEWAGEAPLIFGGDLNLGPATASNVFDALRDRFGLAGQTAPDAIDHLLVRDLDVVEPARQWAPERRELREQSRRKEPDGRSRAAQDSPALRLSDHAPVDARFETETP